MRFCKSGGFTLVEMLVAVTILGLLGIISWRGLDHVMNQRAWISEQSSDVDRVVRTFAQIERDVGQHIADALLSNSLSELPAMPKSVAISSEEHARAAITIMRRHPAGAGVQTVVYRLRDDRLVRMADDNARIGKGAVNMLDDVQAFETRLLSREGWVEKAPLARSRVSALEITIVRINGERYVKVMPL